MIPELYDGVLPQGIHECTMEEVDQLFGRFQKSDRRLRLTQTLRAFIEAARQSGIVSAVVIDGSYVTIKAKPNDIDVMLVLRRDVFRGLELTPTQYNLRSMRMVRHSRVNSSITLSIRYFLLRACDPLQNRRTRHGLAARHGD